MRLIDADAFRDNLNDEYEMGVTDHAEAVSNALDATPALDYAPVVHAHWELKGFSLLRGRFYCSRCGREITVKAWQKLSQFPYCRCGARMDGDGE